MEREIDRSSDEKNRIDNVEIPERHHHLIEELVLYLNIDYNTVHKMLKATIKLPVAVKLHHTNVMYRAKLREVSCRVKPSNLIYSPLVLEMYFIFVNVFVASVFVIFCLIYGSVHACRNSCKVPVKSLRNSTSAHLDTKHKLGQNFFN